MRACGRALFCAVFASWAPKGDSVLAYLGNEASAVEHQNDLEFRERKRTVALRVVENQQAVRRAWARCKVTRLTLPGMLTEDPIHVLILAKTAGFSTVARHLEKKCSRILRCRDHGPYWSFLRGQQASPISDPLRVIASTLFDAGPFSGVRVSIEIVSAVWLVSFLSYLDNASDLEVTNVAQDLNRFLEG